MLSRAASAPAPTSRRALPVALAAALLAIALLGDAGAPAYAQDGLIMQELERREYELGLRMREQRRHEEMRRDDLRRDDLREDDRRALERREDLRRDAAREAERRREIEAEDRRALDRRR